MDAARRRRCGRRRHWTCRVLIMSTPALIAAAHAAIDRVLANYKRPAFMCSFGKDSMVLLHLLRSRGINLPIIFHRDPWWPAKYAFADEVIATWELEIHDYPPFAVSLWEGKEIMAFTNHYQVGALPAGNLRLPKNILSPEAGKKFLCGLNDVLRRPTAQHYNYPWDCVLIGHKSSDQDQIAGKLILHCDIKPGAGATPDAAFPLRQWTDEDVWNYTTANHVPQQSDRYDVENRCEWPDKRPNSDYAHVCIACIDRRETRRGVPCPRLGCEVAVIADQVPYDQPAHRYYGEEAAHASS